MSTRSGWRQHASFVASFVERFLAVEAASGIVLVAAAAAALALANSPLRAPVEALWKTPLPPEDLHFWVNDGLMAIFFFVIGLEIRREVRAGELSTWRRASLPVVAALGGMAAPALVYLAITTDFAASHSAGGGAVARGWAVPVATDIAFAVGVLALLGRRVPPPVRVLLLALAVVDDLGAIVVIAAFYSAEIAASGLAIAALGLGALVLLRKVSAWFVLPLGVVVWAGALTAGVHPALAGVAVGLLVPAEEAERLEVRLHGWVAHVIMPLFALANAGVPVGGVDLHGGGLRLFLGVALGLAIGKPVGILAVSWLAARVRLATPPGWRALAVAGQVAGVGLTMALFIAALAFPPGPLLETAKLAVLCGSALSAIAGLAAGWTLPRPSAPG